MTSVNVQHQRFTDEKRGDSFVGTGCGQCIDETIVAIRQAHAVNEELDDVAVKCLEAIGQLDNQHELFEQVGKVFLELHHWKLAEQFAVYSIKSLPKYRVAFNLLCKALSGAGRLEDAAICKNFDLPVSLREEYFSDKAFRWINSSDSTADGIKRLHAYSSETRPLTPAKQIEDRSIEKFSYQSLTSAKAYTVAVQSGRLWFDGYNIVVWDRYGQLIEDLCLGSTEVVQGSLGNRHPVKIDGRVCLLGNRGTANYYHWMNDALPRLEVLRASGESIVSIDKFVTPTLRKAFHHETLASFGIGKESLHYCNGAEYIEADELLIPVFGSNKVGMNQNCWIPDFLNREILASGGTPPSPVTQTTMLYLSRGSSGARGIVNEQELIDYLQSRNFMVVKSEELSVREQAELFASASVVLGPHGAAFTNTAFCQPGTVVIELFSGHIEPCFWVTSEFKGLEHYVHYCGGDDENTSPEKQAKNLRDIVQRRISPFRVNLCELKAVLDFAGIP